MMKTYKELCEEYIVEAKKHKLVNILQNLIDFHENEKTKHSDAQKGLPVYDKTHQYNHNAEHYHRQILDKLYPALRTMEIFDSFGKKYNGDLNESWGEHIKIFKKALTFLTNDQERKVKGDYSLDTLKSLHTDAIKRISDNFPDYKWKHDKLKTFSPSEEGYGTHKLWSQTHDDETGHNFLVSTEYINGHHVSTIDYGS